MAVAKKINPLNEVSDKYGITVEQLKEIYIVSSLEYLSKTYPDKKFNVNFGKDTLDIFRIYVVVENEEDIKNEYKEISLKDAKKYDSKAKVGSEVKEEMKGKSIDNDLKKIQILVQKQLNGIKNSKSYDSIKDLKGKIVSGKINSNAKICIVELEKGENAMLDRDEQIPGEKLSIDHKYLFYVKDVLQNSKDIPIILSRKCKELISKTLYNDIPEIKDKSAEIISVHRTAGLRTKILVKFNKPNITIGSLIGLKASRINALKENLDLKENIDIVEYSEDFNTLLRNLCYPIYVIGYKKNVDDNSLIIVIQNDNGNNNSGKSKILGRAGSNIKLINEILGFNNTNVYEKDEAIDNNIEYTQLPKFVPKNKQNQNSFSKDKDSNYDNWDEFNWDEIK